MQLSSLFWFWIYFISKLKIFFETFLPVTFGYSLSCRYVTIEERKEAVTKIIDTLTQEDFHETFQKLFERYDKWIAAGGDYFEGD